MTQTDIAKAIGSEQSYVARIERGQTNVTLDTVQKLAAAVGVSTPQILLGSPAGSLTLDILDRMATALTAKLSDLLKEHGAGAITLDMVDTIFGAMLAEARQTGRSRDTSELEE